MNDFESERAAKAARFRQLAEKHANIATGRHFAARERLEVIPVGQPILVGHHSEKRHRKDLTRIDEHFAKAKEHHDKAEYFRRRAAAAESNVIIFSDDPDATEKLVDKIERLKKRQGVMKRQTILSAKRIAKASPTLASLRSIPLTEYCPFRVLTPKCSRSSVTRIAMPNSTFRRCYGKGDETLRPSCVLSPMVRTA